MDCSSPGSSVHAISRARILEWVAISSSRGSSWSRDWTSFSCSSCAGRRIIYFYATWEAQLTCWAFNLSLWLNSPTQPHYWMLFCYIIYIFIWAVLPWCCIFSFCFVYLFGIRQVCTLRLILWVALYLSIYNICIYVAQLAKNLPEMQETWVQPLVREDPLEKGKATPSSILAWGIPWTVSMGSQRVRYDWATFTLHLSIYNICVYRLYPFT